MIINNKREGEQGRGMPRPYLGTVGNVLSAGQSVQDTEGAERAGSDPGEEGGENGVCREIGGASPRFKKGLSLKKKEKKKEKCTHKKNGRPFSCRHFVFLAFIL